MTEQTTEDALDLEALSRSITGFEQIAVRQMFREKVETLAQDGTMFMRAMLFVAEKRAGMSDPDAFRKVMNLPLDEVVERFPSAPADEEDSDAVAERDRAYADFVVGIGLSFTVDQYMALTLGQKAALIEAANRRGA